MLYKATNKTGNGQWIIADNKKEAKEIALKSGHVRKENNCSLQTADENGNSFYQSFKEHGNDMTQVDRFKGVGCVQFLNAQDKGKWLVNSWW